MNPIKTLRLNLSLTQSDLASKCGNTSQTIKDVEMGLYAKCPPSITNYLAAASGTSAASIQEGFLSWVKTTRAENSREFNGIAGVKSFRELAIKVGGSVKGFCRVLVVQPSIVNGYINQGYRSAHLTQALLDCGLSEGIVGALMKLPRT